MASCSRSAGSCGSTISAAATSALAVLAAARTWSGGPSSTMSAMPSCSTCSAARSTRGSVPSGSTIRRRCDRARSARSLANIIGVTMSLRCRSSRSSRSWTATCRSNRSQRGVQLAAGARRAVGDVGQRAAGARGARRGLVGVQRGDGDRQPQREAVDQPADRRVGVDPAGEQQAGQPREGPRPVRQDGADDDVGTIARRDHQDVLAQVVQHAGQRHRADRQREHLPLQPLLGPLQQPGTGGLDQLAEGRRGQQRLLGYHPGHGCRIGGVPAGHRLQRRVDLRLVDPVHHDPDHLGVLLVQRALGDRGGVHRLGRGAPAAGDHQQHRGAELHRDPGVERQLGGGADVGVVGADHEHRLEPGLGDTEPIDDHAHGPVRVGVDVVVGDAVAVGVPAEQGQQRVRTAGPDHRAEDPDQARPAAHRRQQPDGDR